MYNITDLGGVTTVILAGGLGTRLRSTVPHRQKVMAEIGGRPFLTFLLDQLISAGAFDVVLCTGHRADEVYEELGEAYKSLKLRYSRESEPLGTAGALRLALPKIKSQTVMIMNGDSYIDTDIKAFLEWYSKINPAIALIMTKILNTSRYGILVPDDNGCILRFEEKGESELSGWINAGIYLLDKCLLEGIPAGTPRSLERDIFPDFIGKGLYGYRCEGDFLDIGTPESFALAEAFLSKVGLSA